jgi:hypothetical protein
MAPPALAAVNAKKTWYSSYVEVKVPDGMDTEETVVNVAEVTKIEPAVGTVVGPMVTHDVPLYDLTKSVSVS